MLRQLAWCLLRRRSSRRSPSSAQRSTFIAAPPTKHSSCIRRWRCCSGSASGSRRHLHERVGRRPSQAPRVHRNRRRPAQPAPHGFWSVQFGNVFHYLKEAQNPETLERYARDIEEDVWDAYVFRFGFVGPVHRNRRAVLRAGVLVGIARGRPSPLHVRVRAVLVDQRPLPSHRLQKLRQHRDEHPVGRAADRRRRAAQQSSRASAQPEVQLPPERNRSVVADHQAADRAEARPAIQDHSTKSTT